MLYDLKWWRLYRVRVKKLQVNENHILRLAVGVASLDKIENDYIKKSLEIQDLKQKNV